MDVPRCNQEFFGSTTEMRLRFFRNRNEMACGRATYTKREIEEMVDFYLCSSDVTFFLKESNTYAVVVVVIV